MITGDCVGGGGRRGRENGEANKRKNGVSCSTGISLLVFFFFFLIATDIDIVFSSLLSPLFSRFPCFVRGSIIRIPIISPLSG